MKKSKNRLEVMAANLVENPRSLLTSLLMGNMTCNIIVFVVSSLLLSRLAVAIDQDGGGWCRIWCWRRWWCCRPLMVTYAADVFPEGDQEFEQYADCAVDRDSGDDAGAGGYGRSAGRLMWG